MVFKDCRFAKPTATNSGPTRFLYVSCDYLQSNSLPTELLAEFFERFGELDYSDGSAIDLIANRRYCFVCFLEIASAAKVVDMFNRDDSELARIFGPKLIIKYAVERVETKPPPEPDCTSLTEHVVVPGLTVLPNFISEDEEQLLLDEFGGDSAPWKESLQRRVQHYGFPFNYRTLMLDYTKPTPPLSPSCVSLGHRINETFASIETTSSELLPLNQLTLNEYWPGQGIASHTDTEACFGPVLFVLNLNHGIVMNLTKNDSESNDASSECTSGGRKCVYLPARSLLILAGEARYKYSHGISLRKYDKVDGTLLPRGRRISMTFRHALRPGAVSSTHLQSNELELDHVVKVYDNIAVHWNHTRGKRKVWWHRVKDFLDSMPPGTLLADIGSGDGKYFGINPNITAIGCDRSIKLLEVSHDPKFETFCCDAVSLPFRSDVFDATVCIAVLHHLSTVERRYSVLSELVRITRPGGQIMIQAWALEQGGDSKRAFESQDTMVPWKLNKRFLMQGESGENSTGEGEATPTATGGNNKGKKQSADGNSTLLSSNELEQLTGNCKHVVEEQNSGDLVFQRYCHVYKEGELENLCSSIPNCVIDESGWDKGNWFVKLTKIVDERLTQSSIGCAVEVIPVVKARK